METSERNFTCHTDSPKPSVDSSPLGAYWAMGRKRPGHCGRCNAHGIKVPLNGSNHRFMCPFLRCACARCVRIEQDAARRRARHPRLAEQVRNIVANYTTSAQQKQEAQTQTSDLLEPRANATSSLSAASPSPTSEHMSHCGLPVAPASSSRAGERPPAQDSYSSSSSSFNCKNAEVVESMSAPKSPPKTSSADLLAAAYLRSYVQWVSVLSALCPPGLCLPFAFSTPSLAQTPANECTRKRTYKQSEAASLQNDQTIRTRFEENGQPFISSSNKVAARGPDRRSTIPSPEHSKEEWEVCDGLTIHTTPFVSS